MKFNLYYRLLLSYAPIFFVVISMLIFVFFSILNNSAKQQILKTNEVISNQIVQSLDANLEVTERILIREMLGNQAIKLFFNENQKKTLYDYFYISQKLDEIISSMSFVNSIYLYDESNGFVLSRKDLIPAGKFADYSFIQKVYNSNNLQSTWTNPREFKEINIDTKGEKVVSLAKFYPFPIQKKGMVVVNIRVDSLLEYINKLNRNDLNLIKLFDSDHMPFLENSVTHLHIKPKTFDMKLISKKSEYTGWQFEMGMNKTYGFSVMSLLTNIWTILGFLTILIGIAWLTYTTHRNYKPVQSIISRIHHYTNKKSEQLGTKASGDEYKFIESAIDNLIEKSTQFEKLHKDDLILRKKHFFLELLETSSTLQEHEWQQEMERFEKPEQFSRLVVVVIELDNYAEFSKSSNQKDQYLQKFIVHNVFEDIAQSNGAQTWSEWTNLNQLTSIIYLNETNEPYQETVMHISKRMQEWIGEHLQFTVSIGVGAEIDNNNDIHFSYETAKEYISFKQIFGTNQIIGHWSLVAKTPGDVFQHLQKTREIAEQFRLGEEQWKMEYTNLFHSIKEKLLSKSDLKHLMDYMFFHFQKEIMKLAEEIQSYWKTETLPLLEEVVQKADTLDELSEKINTTLCKLEEQIAEVRNQRRNSLLISKVKEYIKCNFQNMDLSLNGVSEQFNMSSRYLSRIFKEELGENFNDFIVKLRMSHAKYLLLETDLSIQEISEQVGYIHAMSFIRTFKKINGSTPGVYRKSKGTVIEPYLRTDD
jgi:two-component system response regulator YesN